MIVLQEIFDTLATGEFSNMKLGNSLQGTIEEANYPKIVNAVNLGLLNLHKRFPLRKGEFILHQHADVTEYYLREAYSGESGEMGSSKYIELASGASWPDDFIKVNSLWDEDNEEIPLNDAQYRDTGGFTPSFDVLRMTPRTPPITVQIEYRAKYPKIVIDETFDPENVELHIPDFIEEPLLYFVASRIFRGIASKATEGETTSAITYATLYRTACKEIENQGLVTTDDDTGSQFNNNGWT